MKLITCIYGLATCYVFVRGAEWMKDVEDADDDSKERRDDIIREVVRSLLGVKELSDTDGSAPRRTPPPPPHYMLDLYDRYKSGESPVQGNTVRSILPMRGKLKGVDMLVFNLTGIDADEQILQGKLHIFRRRQSRRGNSGSGGGGGGGGRKREAVRLKIADLSLKSPPHWIDVPKQKNSGWQSFDVTNSVVQCRTAPHDGDHLLGVSSETRRPNGKFKLIPIRRIARLSSHSQPFLIIFSEDRNNRTVNNNITEKETASPSYEEIREMLLSRRNNSSEDFRPAEGSSLLRHKRAVRSETFLNYLSSVRNISDPEKSTNVSMDDHRADYSKDSWRKTNASSFPALPGQSNLQEARKRPQKVKKANKRKKQRKEKDSRSISDRKCQRKDLIVDFTLLGWDEWIMSPRSFNAYYCTGSCDMSGYQTNVSNHAVIQSLLHANKDLTVNSEKVPAPCCVPNSTKTLRVLFLDMTGRAMLKNFSNMIVESCACR